MATRMGRCEEAHPRLRQWWTERFHIWELHWTENQMQISLDGELLNTVDLNRTINGSAACAGQNPFRQPHYILNEPLVVKVGLYSKDYYQLDTSSTTCAFIHERTAP